MKKLKDMILQRIRPSSKEAKELKRIGDEIISKLKIAGTKSEVGGSVAKGTWLKGSHDIDIYVKFGPKRYEGKDISSTLKKTLEKNYDADMIHGSRDYYQIKHGPYTVEIVPILDIKRVSDAKNITDVSPFHVRWVRKHKDITDEIRLAKAFCKANKIYGAESYIKGFSGYVLEILTVHYGSFNGLMRHAAKWGAKTIIDAENFHRGKDIGKELNIAKVQSPLILIDPVQKDRNVAAGLDREKYDKLKSLAKEFLKNPSEDYFVKKKIEIENLRKMTKGKKLILIEAEPLDGKKDVVGAKLMKFIETIDRHLKLNDFNVIDKGWEWEGGKALHYFILDKKSLSPTMKHYGPHRSSKSRMESFKARWKGKKIKFDNKIAYVIVKRDYRDAAGFVKDFVKNEFVKDKIKKVRLI